MLIIAETGFVIGEPVPIVLLSNASDLFCGKTASPWSAGLSHGSRSGIRLDQEYPRVAGSEYSLETGVSKISLRLR